MNDLNYDKIKDYKREKYSKLYKRLKILAIILFFAGIFTFLCTSDYFNIKSINYQGCETISSEKLNEELSSIYNQNIFIYDNRYIKLTLKKNSYIKSFEIKRKNINTLSISITEELPLYCIKIDEGYAILNEDLKVLEISENNAYECIELVGLTYPEIKVNEKLDVDTLYLSSLSKLLPYILQTNYDVKFDIIDLTNIIDIKCKTGDVDILLGDDSNLKDKMEVVFSVLLSDKISLKKGYINVSFDGTPVIKKES